MYLTHQLSLHAAFSDANHSELLYLASIGLPTHLLPLEYRFCVYLSKFYGETALTARKKHTHQHMFLLYTAIILGVKTAFFWAGSRQLVHTVQLPISVIHISTTIPNQRMGVR